MRVGIRAVQVYAVGVVCLIGGAAFGEGGGPDVNYTDVGSINNYGQEGGIRGYALGSHTCNIGDQNLLWTNDGTPGLAMNAYRLHDGRLEQIGQSWVKHACCAAAGNGCGLSCNGAGGNQLGAGCRDIYSAGWNGIQGNLGPRSGINAYSGAFSSIPGGGAGAIARRLQVAESDLSAANFPDALYFVEGVYVGTDDAQTGNAMNNASHKRVTVGGDFSLFEAGVMQISDPALYAWHDHGNGLDNPDESVEIAEVDVPGEGRFVYGSTVRDNGDGTWRYSYAVFNLNSDRSGGSFSVPVDGSVSVTGAGFHGVPYHSGEPYDNADWNVAVDGSAVRWSSPQTHDENPNSNAIRWGTMYTFWFDANSAPTAADVTLGLFKAGSPNAVSFSSKSPTALCATPTFVAAASGVSFSDRAFDGFVDARKESDDGINVNLGLDTFAFEFTTEIENVDGSPLSVDAFTVSDSSGTPPTVQGISTEDGRRVTVTLSDHIALQQWTEFNVQARAMCDTGLVMNESLRVGYLPCDVNQDGEVSPFDLLTFRQYVDGTVPDAGIVVDYVDTDRNGVHSPFDLLAFRQLVNGVSPPATRVWAGESLP